MVWRRTNADPIHWRTYAELGWDKLMMKSARLVFFQQLIRRILPKRKAQKKGPGQTYEKIIHARSIYSYFLWQQQTVWGSPGVGSRTNTRNYSDVKIKQKWRAIANSLLSLHVTKKLNRMLE